MNLRHQQYIDSILRYGYALFNLKSVSGIAVHGIFESTEKNIGILSELLKKGKYDALEGASPVKDLFGEDIAVISFLDQGQKKYFALIHESAQLWEDPAVIKIFPFA